MEWPELLMEQVELTRQNGAWAAFGASLKAGFQAGET
jgi:hypothetical protein